MKSYSAFGHFCKGLILITLCMGIWTKGSTVFSQEKPDYFFDHYIPGDVLPSSQILGISQGMDKTIWVGTENGLLSFDGHHFKRWSNPIADSLKLLAEYVSHVVADRHNQIWFLGHNRLYRLNPETGKVAPVPLPGLPFDPQVYKIKYESASDILYLFTNKGVFFTSCLKLNIQQFPYLNKLSRNDFSDLVRTSKDEIWLVRPDSLIRFFPESGKIVRYAAHFQYQKKNLLIDYLNIAFDGHHTLWIGTWSQGLLKFDIPTQKFSHHYWGDLSRTQHTVYQTLIPPIASQPNTLWLCTNSGLVRFSTTNQKFETYIGTNPSDPKTVHGLAFCGLFDNRANMWIGTYYGLHKFDLSKQVFKNFSSPQLAKLENWIESMAFYGGQQNDSLAYIAFSYGPLVHIDLKRGKDLPLPKKLIPYAQPENLIHEAFVDDRQNLYVSSRKKGLIQYNLQTDKLLQIKHEDEKHADQILSIFKDKNQHIWMGGLKYLHEYDEQKHVLKAHTFLYEWLKKHNYTTYLVDASFDNQQNLWVIVNNRTTNLRSVVSYHPLTQSIHEYKANEIPSLFMLGPLESLSHVKDDQFIVGGNNGLAFFRGDATRIFEIQKVVKNENNIFGGYKAIKIGKNGAIWLNSAFGVAQTRLNSRTISHFSYQNSSISTFPDPFISLNPAGNILWVKQNGGFKYAPIEKLIQNAPDSIYLTALSVKNYENFGYRPDIHNLSLDYDQNTLEFQFSMYNFSGLHFNQFEYSLNNESQWQTLESNTLNLSSMGSGIYHLKVRGINGHGIPSINTLEYRFEISPPFWKSAWFFFLLLLGGVSIVASYFYLKEAQRKRLENLRNSIARDLHDEMGSTLSQINIMSELMALKSSDETYKTIHQKIKEVMTTMSEIVWSINPKKDSLPETISKIQEFAIDILESKGVDLHFNISKLNESKVLSPDQRRHIYLIFKEAINNAAKYANARNAWFSVAATDKKITLSFRDDGSGFDVNSVKPGNGLYSMAERAQSAGFLLQIKSNSLGTDVTLSI